MFVTCDTLIHLQYVMRLMKHVICSHHDNTLHFYSQSLGIWLVLIFLVIFVSIYFFFLFSRSIHNFDGIHRSKRNKEENKNRCIKLMTSIQLCVCICVSKQEKYHKTAANKTHQNDRNELKSVWFDVYVTISLSCNTHVLTMVNNIDRNKYIYIFIE